MGTIRKPHMDYKDVHQNKSFIFSQTFVRAFAGVHELTAHMGTNTISTIQDEFHITHLSKI